MDPENPFGLGASLHSREAESSSFPAFHRASTEVSPKESSTTENTPADSQSQAPPRKRSSSLSETASRNKSKTGKGEDAVCSVSASVVGRPSSAPPTPESQKVNGVASGAPSGEAVGESSAPLEPPFDALIPPEGMRQ